MTPARAKLCGLLAACAIAGGCSTFVTDQRDESYENGQLVRTVRTRAKARTLFDARSQLANFKASQTDKTQSAVVGALNQRSEVSTNVAAVAGTFFGAALRAYTGAP